MKKLLQETDPRFYRLEKKVGVFITAAIILGVLIIIVMKHDILTPQYTLYFTADKGKGISEGMSVRLSGFKVGKVVSLSLDEQAQVRVKMTIWKKYIQWISKDSMAKVVKEGLWGESSVEISVGSPQTPRVEDKASIAFETTKDLGDVIEELKPTLEEIKGTINYINDPKGDVKVTLNNFRRLSEQLFTSKEHLDALLRNTDGTVNKLDLAVTTVNKDLPKIMNQLSRSADNIEKMTGELKIVVEQSAPKIPSSINAIESAASETKEILGGAKRAWPINNMVTPPQEKVLKGDSFE